jgi:5-methylcytosine-specific restriction endonuclease McrA
MEDPKDKPKDIKEIEQIKEVALKKRKRKIGYLEFRRKKRRNEQCAYCKKRKATTTEHFIPQSSGLEIAFKKINLIPACRPCNQHKGGRWPSEREIGWFFDYWDKQLLAVQEHLKIAHAVKRNRHGHVVDESESKPKGRRPKQRRRAK